MSDAAENEIDEDGTKLVKPKLLDHLGIYVKWNQDCNLGPPPFIFIPTTGPENGCSVLERHGNLITYVINRKHGDSRGCLASLSGLKFKMKENPTKLSPVEDHLLRAYYDGLQYVLYETGYRETKDRTRKCDELRDSHARLDKYNKRISVVVFTDPSDCLGILFEGGKQCPGDLLLVLSSSWLFKVKYSDNPPLCAVYVTKAIVFTSGKKSHIKHFYPPRRATYLMNLLTSDCTAGRCSDGDEIEKYVDCPMGTTVKLAQWIDDKLWTRIQMAKAGLAFPETLAFAFYPAVGYDTTDIDTVTVVTLEDKTVKPDFVLEYVQKFLVQPYMRNYKMIIVKPSGSQWSGSTCVTFHRKENVQEICQAAMDILPLLSKGNSILIEAFHETLQRHQQETAGGIPSYYPLDWRVTDEHAARIRVTAVKTADNRAKCCKIVCGVWYRGSSVNGSTTMAMSVSTLLTSLGITDRVEQRRVEERLRADSERLMRGILDHVGTLSWEQKGACQADCDMAGIDYILSDHDGEIVPVAIEVNGPSCTVNCHMNEFTHPEQTGEAFEDIVTNMIMKSYEFAMAGKRIVVIGPHPPHVELLKAVVRNYSLKMIMVDSNSDRKPVWDTFAEFLAYDFTDHALDSAHSANIIQLVGRENMDACVTFDSRYFQLVSLVSAQLGSAGPSAAGSLKCLQFDQVQETLMRSNRNIPHFALVFLYALQSIRTKNHVMQDACQKFQGFNTTRNDKVDPPIQSGRTSGKADSIRLAPRYRVYLVMYERKIVAAFLCDVAAGSASELTDLILTMPSRAPPDIQDIIVCAAYQCCVEVDLVSGVFVPEFWLTGTGPKLMHIHSALESLYIIPFIKTLYGTDLLFLALLIACDIKPIISSKPINPAKRIVGILTNKLKSVRNQNILINGDSDYKTAEIPCSAVTDSTGLCGLSCQSFDTKLHKTANADENIISSSVSSTEDLLTGQPDTLPGIMPASDANNPNYKFFNSKGGEVSPLQALVNGGVVKVEWLVHDSAVQPDSSLIYGDFDDLSCGLDRLCGVLNIVGLGEAARRLSEFLMDFKDFDAGSGPSGAQ